MCRSWWRWARLTEDRGRTKSPHYAARTRQAYRQAIDDAVAGRSLDPALLAQLDGLANRGYTDGWLLPAPPRRRLPELPARPFRIGAQPLCRRCRRHDTVRGLAEIDVKNRFAVGDRLEIVHPAGNIALALTRLKGRWQRHRGRPGNGHRVWALLPAASVGAFVARSFSRS